MNIKFNSFDLATPPKISIHRVDLEMIGYLQATNIVIKATYCNSSELTFRVYKDTQHYDCILKNMVLEVEGFGRWQIAEPGEDDDGTTPYKDVTAYSYEVALNNVTLSYKDDTVFKLWDATHPMGNGSSSKPTLLGIIQSQTNWKIAHVDGTLLNSYRTMSIDNEEIYGLLMGDISDAFKCYFLFDTTEMKIYCYDREKAVVNSGINLSFKNVVNKITKKQSSEDVTTALTVNGAEGVGINLVNPLGNNVIYDFSYYMNDNEWGMPSDLQNAVRTWMNKIEEKKTNYKSLVLNRRTLSDELITLDGELSVLTSELKSWQDVQAVDIAGNPDDLPRVNAEINRVNGLITAKNTQITNKKNQYNQCISSINSIVSSLSFENNFTTNQLYTLNFYINGSVYENSNFVFTSVQTESEQIDMSQQLYDQGLTIMDKLSKPLYEFSCEVSGFMFSKEYEEFTKNLELGVAANLEIEDGVWVSPKIMQIVIDFDSIDNATIVLADSYRLSDDIYVFSDGYNQTVKASRKTSLSASKWDEPNNNNFYSSVTEYMNNALNLVNQEIINANNQEFTLGSYGLRGKKYLTDSKTYDSHQIAMTNNVLAFTDDNWNSCKAALGYITIGQTQYYGLVAEAIMGNLIAGNQLTISNNNNTFIVDGSGATLKNSDFSVENNTNKILISPTDGFKIQKKNGESWEDVLTANSSGDLVITGSVEAATGSKIAGWTTTATRLTSPTGDYIGSDGTGKLSLMTWNNTSATFNGNIYANNLNWKYGDTDYSVFRSVDGGWMLDGQNLPSEDIFFGGQFYKENKDKTTGVVKSYAKLYMDRADIDTQIKGQETIFAESGGNFIIKSKNGGLVLRGTDDDGSEINPHGILTTKLSVTKESTYNGKATFFDEIDSQKNLIVTDVSAGGDGTIHFKSNAAFEGSVWFTKNQLIGVVMTDEHGAEQSWYTVTQEVNVGDKTLKFVHGLFVGAW